MIVDREIAQDQFSQYKYIWEQYDTPLQEVLRELYSQGWYFQTDDGVWGQQNIDLLLQDINNPFKDSVMSDLHVVDSYLGFGINQHNAKYILLKHGIDESNDWPNNIIKKAIGLFPKYDAINKKKVINK